MNCVVKTRLDFDVKSGFVFVTLAKLQYFSYFSQVINLFH